MLMAFVDHLEMLGYESGVEFVLDLPLQCHFVDFGHDRAAARPLLEQAIILLDPAAGTPRSGRESAFVYALANAFQGPTQA